MNSVIEKRKLGKTNIEVSVLGFGSAPLGDIYEFLDDEINELSISADFSINRLKDFKTNLMKSQEDENTDNHNHIIRHEK